MFLDWELCIGTMLVKSARIRTCPLGLGIIVMGSFGPELFFPVQMFGRFSCSSVSKEFTCNVGACLQTAWMPGLGRSPGEGNGNPLQLSYQGNLMDRGAWWVIVRGVAKELDTTQWLNHHPRPQGERIKCGCLPQTVWLISSGLCPCCSPLIMLIPRMLCE